MIKKELEALNHSCAHLLAQTIKRLYPEALFWVGPVIDEGFYYDIDLGDQVIKEDDLVNIEKEMKKLAKKNKLIKKQVISKEEALKLFASDPYKLDLLADLEDEVSVYWQDDFVDLCRGPHVESTKELRHFKLLKVSGAYYKGDSNNKMLQRIYGICFETKEDLDNYLVFLEEVKKRDHKKLGKELELFMFSEYGSGFPFWLPKGMVLKRELENFWFEQHHLEGYSFIQTPVMLNKELWELSGHYDNYKENMYLSEIEQKEFAIKPMNCPGGMLVFKNKLHSYKDFPLRIGELGLVHRHEASGALNGLLRVRNFWQDDAHIFMTENQIELEVMRLIDFIDRMYGVFGLKYSIELSTKPVKSIGKKELWEKSEKALASSCQKAGKDFIINEGDGAFYGPKLDFIVTDAIGRKWQCGTIQLDMNLPERFDLVYIEKDGSKQRPIMLHRVIYGSMERFIAILIEHYAGAFPLWLSPIQVVIMPVNNEYHLDYVQTLGDLFTKNNIRFEIDDREEKLSYKIREAQMNKVPYMLIIGDEEKENNLVSYRKYGNQTTEKLLKEEFFNKLIDEIVEKKC